MTDRTTKALLFAIALGLWINFVGGGLRALPAQAQGASLRDGMKMDEIATELKKISSDTAALRETLNRIYVMGGRK